MRRLRAVGPVTAYGVSPAGGAASVATGYIDATGINPGVDIGNTFTIYGIEFLLQLDGVPATSGAQAPCNFTGDSPAFTITNAITDNGVCAATVRGVSLYIVDLASYDTGSAQNVTVTTTAPNFVVGGMSGGSDGGAGGISPWPSRI